MAEADTEAREMRRALAREMLLDCESELSSAKQAAAALEGRVQQLEAEAQEKEENQLELLSKIRNQKAWIAASERVRQQTSDPDSEITEAKAKIDGLSKKLARSLGELDKTGRIASNAAAETAEVREEAASWLQKHGEIAEELENLQLEKDGLLKNIASINGRAKKAAQASAAKISTLQSELSASRAQVAAILQGIADTQGDSGKE